MTSQLHRPQRRRARVIAGSITASTVALSTVAVGWFAGSSAAADPTQPYDLQATGVMTRHVDDPSLVDIDVTVVNKGPGSVDNVLMGPRADFGVDTDTTLVAVQPAGQTAEAWACAHNPAQPYLLTQCFYPNLEAGEIADQVKLTLRVNPNATLVKGSIGTLGAEDLPKPSAERREGEPYSNYAFFAFGSQVTTAPALSGQVWNDWIPNGKRDSWWESPYAGVTVTLRRDGIPVWQTTTDANGYYEAYTLWEGNYEITIDAPRGLKFSEPGRPQWWDSDKPLSNVDSKGKFSFTNPDVKPRNPVNIPPENLSFHQVTVNAGLNWSFWR